MKKTFILIASLALICCSAFAQKKTSTSAMVNFDATTSSDQFPKAENKTAVASMDIQKGTVAFEVVIKSFTFSNPKIQEHFNGSSWMDSEKFPTATFKGNITNLSDINFTKDGTYKANVEGDLSIRGETKKVKTDATLVIKGKSIKSTAEFAINLDDYKITGSAITMGKVAKEPKITVSAEFK